VQSSSERLEAKAEGSTHLGYTGLRGGLEHLKIETWSRDEGFESVKGACVIKQQFGSGTKRQ
jgi:hypothetical protein